MRRSGSSFKELQVSIEGSRPEISFRHMPSFTLIARQRRCVTLVVAARLGEVRKLESGRLNFI
jgi:hypothetical protein